MRLKGFLTFSWGARRVFDSWGLEYGLLENERPSLAALYTSLRKREKRHRLLVKRRKVKTINKNISVNKIFFFFWCVANWVGFRLVD